jgi:hypothetical protein
MRTGYKLLLVALAVLGLSVGVAMAARGGDEPATGPTSTLRGPCDEPENANDRRCGGTTTGRDDDRRRGGDVRGPCDEAEHANDSRCRDGGDGRGSRGPGSGGGGGGSGRG